MEELKIFYPKGIFHAPAWKEKEKDVRKSLDGECKFCYIIENRTEQELLEFKYQDFIYFIFVNSKPYFPGHLLLIPKLTKNDHKYDIKLFNKRYLDSVLNLLKLLSDSDIWIGANFGYVAGQSIMHPHFHLMYPPEKVSREFFEEAEIPDYVDNETNKFLGYRNGFKIVRFIKKENICFYGYYIEIDRLSTEIYLKFLSYLNSTSIRLYGREISYNLLLAERKLYIVPRASFYNGKRIALLELFYNSELRRNLKGKDEKRFWEVAKEENKRIFSEVLRLLKLERE